MVWITTPDVAAETWRFLLEYANIDIACEALARLHGQATDKSTRSNYKKQARQIRVTILQAHEYFLAAEASTLFTRSNHLYYGMISLASAMMLLRGDGAKALDRLRSDSSNQHHGLDFTTGVNAERAGVGLNLLECSYVRVRSHGHFLNWYATLPQEEAIYALVRQHTNISVNVSRESRGSQPKLPPSQIVARKRSVLDLLRYLPDLRYDLTRYGVDVPSSRVSSEIHIYSNKDTIYQWRIHSATSPEHFKRLLQGFIVPSAYEPYLERYEDHNGRAGTVRLKVAFSEEATDFTTQTPSCRQTLSHDEIMYVDDLDTYEIIDAYLAGYALSMLSRYYPDIWINCLESHCKAAQLIESLVFVLMRKFLAMTLSVMASEEIIISTHRPPWYEY